MSGRAGKSRRILSILSTLGVFLAVSLAAVSRIPRWAPWIGFADGLAVGTVMGATGLLRSYDESWDEFFETAALTFFLGVFALIVYWIRRETPSAFFVVECAAGIIGYLMLLFIPPLEWIGVDSLLFFGTFLGWFFSGLFRPEYD